MSKALHGHDPSFKSKSSSRGAIGGFKLKRHLTVTLTVLALAVVIAVVFVFTIRIARLEESKLQTEPARPAEKFAPTAPYSGVPNLSRTQQVQMLHDAFASPDPSASVMVEKAVAAIQEGKVEEVLKRLELVERRSDLTPEQKRIVEDLRMQALKHAFPHGSGVIP